MKTLTYLIKENKDKNDFFKYRMIAGYISILYKKELEIAEDKLTSSDPEIASSSKDNYELANKYHKLLSFYINKVRDIWTKEDSSKWNKDLSWNDTIPSYEDTMEYYNKNKEEIDSIINDGMGEVIKESVDNSDSDIEHKIKILKEVKAIMDSLEPLKRDIIYYLNQEDIDYSNWKDVDMYIYYLENKDIIDNYS